MMNMNNNNERAESTMFDSAFASRVGDVEDVLQDMKSKAQDAYQDHDDIMLALYEEVCRVISPIVTRYAARARREELAAMNKNKKELRKAAREEREREKEAREKAEKKPHDPAPAQQA